MNYQDAVKRYGEIINGKWAKESIWCRLYDIEYSWFPSRKIYCNIEFIHPFLMALKKIDEKGLGKEIKTYDGCFNVRSKRGIPEQSVHSYGLAIDLNAYIMPLNAASKWSNEFVQCFKDVGFEWGGEWPRKDCMHFQLKGLW